MGLFYFFKRQKISLDKHIIRSKRDLEIPSSYLLYVENEYHAAINKLLTEKYDDLTEIINHHDHSGRLIYMPCSLNGLFDAKEKICSLINYYYPNAKNGDDFLNKISNTINTRFLTDLIFSSLEYHGDISPGFLRFVRKETQSDEEEYIYEYIRFDLNNCAGLEEQVMSCIGYCYNTTLTSLTYNTKKSHRTNISEKFLNIFKNFFDDDFEENQYPSPDSTYKPDDSDNFSDTFPAEEDPPNDRPVIEEAAERSIKKTSPGFQYKKLIFEEKETDEDALFDIPEFLKRKRPEEKTPEQTAAGYRESGHEPEWYAEEPEWFAIKQDKPEEQTPATEGPDLIARIKSDIVEAKNLGLLDMLIKEIEAIIFDDEDKASEPSRLVIDQDFKICLPDFGNREIEMTPLPKTLFILFLRHPEGIFLKQIADYKTELLEIYKLLSYKENFSDIVESIDRICNPTDGSINEKLSRIKEAFIKKISIDTAKHYLITGERGQKKKIILNPSLIEIPSMFEEISLTNQIKPSEKDLF